MKYFILIALLVNTALFLLVGQTPLSDFVYGRIMGTEGELLLAVRQSLLLFTLSVPFYGWYMYQQAQIILANKPNYILYSMIVQLVVIYLSMLVLAQGFWLTGSASATLSYSLGIIFATIFLEILIRIKGVRSRINALDDKEGLEQKPRKQLLGKVLLFFFPLVLATVIFDVVIPLINSVLARSEASVINLSSFDISWGLAWLALGCIEVAHQVPLFFLRKYPREHRRMFRFLMGFALLCGVVLAIIGFSPLGNYLLIQVMGVESATAFLVLKAMQVLSLSPIVYMLRQYFWGVLMHGNDTGYITWGKAINLVLLFAMLLATNKLTFINPVVYVFAAMILAEALEIVFLFVVTLRHKKKVKTRAIEESQTA